jgi:hypothetical protein
MRRFIPSLIYSLRQEGVELSLRSSHYGFLFFTVFAVFSARRDAGLSFYVSGAVSAERGAAMGGFIARHLSAARADFDLYFSEHGRRQRLVHRASGRHDSRLFRRRSPNIQTPEPGGSLIKSAAGKSRLCTEIPKAGWFFKKQPRMNTNYTKNIK